ncbi:MAG: aldo/keto reductase, partial [Candidatus Nanopelagicaceae bacterium]
MITIPRTDLTIYPLSLGGNVFGWTASKEESFKVLDRFAELGGNFIDTADVYSAWKEGNSGGESESIIGEWMESRGNRNEMIIATKVAKLPTRPG